MAKRFIDTELLLNPNLRVIPTLYKLFWIGLITRTDHAGIWVKDFEMMSLLCGEKIDEEKTLEFFSKDIVVIDGGKRWFIPKFLQFQYPNGLNKNVKAHISVIKILEKFSLYSDGKVRVGVTLTEGIQDKDKDKVIDMDMDLDQDSDKDNDQKKQFNDFSKDSYFSVDRLSEVYLEDEKLLGLVSKNTGKSVETLKSSMPDFVEKLKTEGRSTETPGEFAKYFRNIHKGNFQINPSPKNQSDKNQGEYCWTWYGADKKYGTKEQYEFAKKTWDQPGFQFKTIKSPEYAQ